ncbi:alpha-endosulfine [Agrilus planipennis]|uniref:Alpha-endosulfine n=1 Tax=Agrilus planipennis TaxID=224129 RepID=A0A7F5R0M7_AGRPL|nr:alpha-endosulfine [Agrilus planipennis]
MSEEKSEQEQTPELSAHQLEKLEEQKLRSKYPGGLGTSNPDRSLGGHSAFLQKRLAKGQKFFDSGDYQMAKQKMGNINKPQLKVAVPVNPYATGDAIPTPETVPIRKTSIIQQTKFTPNVG